MRTTCLLVLLLAIGASSTQDLPWMFYRGTSTSWSPVHMWPHTFNATNGLNNNADELLWYTYVRTPAASGAPVAFKFDASARWLPDAFWGSDGGGSGNFTHQTWHDLSTNGDEIQLVQVEVNTCVKIEFDERHVRFRYDDEVDARLCDAAWRDAPYAAGSEEATAAGWTSMLTLNEDGQQATTRLSGKSAARLKVEATYASESIARVQITDPDEEDRFQVPGVVQLPMPAQKPDAPEYRATVGAVSPVSLLVESTDRSRTFLRTAKLFWTQRYMELSTALPENTAIYGLGERIWDLVAFDTSSNQTVEFSFFTSDQGTPWQRPTYGSHPFLVALDQNSGEAYGIYFLTSSPLDMVLTSSSLEVRFITGIIDVFVFTGPSVAEVVQQYQAVIGTPALMPRWSLGFHQCRWGYHDVDDLRAVIQGFKDHDLPFDTQWIDIDYMHGWRMFTFDKDKFPAAQMKEVIDELHDEHRHFVFIVDPGVKIETNYSAYESGVQNNVFLLDTDGKPAIGKVWPGYVNFPDWTHKNATAYWRLNLNDFVAAASESPAAVGIWTDMNEVASFCDGRCVIDPFAHHENDDLFTCDCENRTDTRLEDQPPYLIFDLRSRSCRSRSGDVVGYDCGSLSFTVRHENGYLERDMHNMFGHYEATLTAKVLRETSGQRPFVLTRSTFPSTGAHVAHWLGDNESTWAAMKQSIAGALSFGLFGFGMVGADVCGFSGNTTAELCTRWMQLGTFLTFFRNHNQENMVAQEPYVFGEPYTGYMRTTLELRYSLIPHLYTLHEQAHTDGGVILNALAWEFPKDGVAGAQDQFLVGTGLLVTPVLTEGATQVEAHFPASAVWWNWYDGRIQQSGVQTLNLDLSRIPLHIRGGHVVVLQEPGLSLHDQEFNPYALAVALPFDIEHYAKAGEVLSTGKLYLDDGVSLEPQATRLEYEVTVLQAGQGHLRIASRVTQNEYDVSPDHHHHKLKFYGLLCTPERAVLHMEGSKNQELDDAKFSVDTSIWQLSNVVLPLAQNWQLYVVCECSGDDCPTIPGGDGRHHGGDDDDNSDTVKIAVAVVLSIGAVAGALWLRVWYKRRQAQREYADIDEDALLHTDWTAARGGQRDNMIEVVDEDGHSYS